MSVLNLLSKPQDDQPLEIKPWNELTVAASIVIHMSWIVPWFYLITIPYKPPSEGRLLVVFCLVEAGVYLVVRLEAFFNLKLRIRQGSLLVALGLGWLAEWLVLKPGMAAASSVQMGSLGTMVGDLGGRLSYEILLLVVVLLFGMFAMDMAREWNSPGVVFNRLRLNVIMLCLFGLIAGQKAGELTVFSVYLFLGAGMIALVASRMASLERKRGDRQGAFDRRWLLAVVGLTVVMVGMASFVSNLVTGQMGRLLQALRAFFTAFITSSTS